MVTNQSMMKMWYWWNIQYWYWKVVILMMMILILTHDHWWPQWFPTAHLPYHHWDPPTTSGEAIGIWVVLRVTSDSLPPTTHLLTTCTHSHTASPATSCTFHCCLTPASASPHGCLLTSPASPSLPRFEPFDGDGAPHQWPALTHPPSHTVTPLSSASLRSHLGWTLVGDFTSLTGPLCTFLTTPHIYIHHYPTVPRCSHIHISPHYSPRWWLMLWFPDWWWWPVKWQ